MKIFKVIKAYRKLGHKEFMKKFKGGLMKITPDEILKVRLISLGGQGLGLIFAIIMIIIVSSFWYIVIALGFAAIFTGTQFLETYQQYQTLKKIQTQMANLNDFMGGKEDGVEKV